MRQISARQFRTTFADLEETVVVLRQRQGGFDVLGTWVPNGAAFLEATSAVLAVEGQPRIDFRAARPAPKSARRG